MALQIKGVIFKTEKNNKGLYGMVILSRHLLLRPGIFQCNRLIENQLTGS
jgi:hypothetical protein